MDRAQGERVCCYSRVRVVTQGMQYSLSASSQLLIRTFNNTGRRREPGHGNRNNRKSRSPLVDLTSVGFASAGPERDVPT